MIFRSTDPAVEISRELALIPAPHALIQLITLEESRKNWRRKYKGFSGEAPGKFHFQSGEP